MIRRIRWYVLQHKRYRKIKKWEMHNNKMNRFLKKSDIENRKQAGVVEGHLPVILEVWINESSGENESSYKGRMAEI